MERISKNIRIISHGWRIFAMKLAQTNGTLFKYYGSVLETFEHLAKAGFKYVDISFYDKFSNGSDYFRRDLDEIAEEYKSALEKTGLVPVQSHEPLGNSMGADGGKFYFKKTPRAIELAGKIGIPTMAIHPGWNFTEDMSRNEFMTRTAETFKTILETAEKANVKLLIENTDCMNDGNHLATAEDLLEMIERVGNHPLLGICWDVGHANLWGGDQYTSIKMLGDKLGGIHVSDNLGVRGAEYDAHEMPYHGNVNFDAVLAGLKEINYRGPFAFEVDAPTIRKGIKPFKMDGMVVNNLAKIPAELRVESDKLLYNIGKHMLETYGCYEG